MLVALVTNIRYGFGEKRIELVIVNSAMTLLAITTNLHACHISDN